MDKRKVTQKVDMFDRVKLVCEDNIAIINSVVALGDSYTAFKDKLVLVKDRMEQVSILENGYAAQKEAMKEDLSFKLKALCGGLRAFAKKSGNIPLQMQAKFARTRFLQQRGTDAIATAHSLLDLVTEHVASLAPFNVTPAKLTLANDLLTQLEGLNGVPTSEISNDKVLRELLFKQVKDTTTVLSEEVDPLVMTLEQAEAEFAGMYFAARRIHRTGIRHDDTTDDDDGEEGTAKNAGEPTLEPFKTVAKEVAAPPTVGATTAHSQNGVMAV